jgi:hypothetical protein
MILFCLSAEYSGLIPRSNENSQSLTRTQGFSGHKPWARPSGLQTADLKLKSEICNRYSLRSEDKGSPQGTDLFPAAEGLAGPSRSEKMSD